MIAGRNASRARIGLFVVVCVIALMVLLTRGQVNTNLSGFMPEAKTTEQQLLSAGITSGASARWLLLGIAGGEMESRGEIARKLGGDLRGLRNFSNVSDGSETELDIASLEKLFRYRLLLHPGLDDENFSTMSLAEGLRLRVQQVLGGGGAVAERLLQEDPLLSTEAILENLSRGGAERNRVNGAWVSSGGNMHLLAVQTAAGGSELDAQAENLAIIRQAFETLNPDGSHELLVTGTAVFAVMSRDSIKLAVKKISIAASLGVFVLLLFWFRSFRALLLAALPLTSGMLVGVAAVILVFGSIHATSLAFGLTLLGVVVDYPIHYFSHRRYEESKEKAMTAVWPPLRIGALTTALAYLVFLTTGFPGLRQLGLLNITGVLTALAVTRWILPELSASLRFKQPLLPSPPAMRHAGKLGFLPLVLLLLGSLVLWQSGGVHWQDDPEGLSPFDPAQLAVDRELRQAVAGPDAGRLLVVSGESVEAVLQRQETLRPHLVALRDSGALGGFELAANWLPSQAAQLANRELLPGKAELQLRLTEATNRSGVRAESTRRFAKAVEQSRSLSPLTLDDIANSPIAGKLDALLHDDGDSVLGLVPLHGVAEPDRIRQTVAGQAGVTYVDLRQVASSVMRGFRSEALYRVGLGGGVIIIALVVMLGSVRRGFAILLPILATLAVVVSVLAATGEALNLFHLLSLLLVAGISMDYGLFFARSTPDLQTRVQTFWSVAVCAVTTLMVFGILAGSGIPVLRAMGLTTFIGVATGFLVMYMSVKAKEI